MASAAKKLKVQLYAAYKEFHHIFKFQQTAFTQLSHLKKVYEQVHFKGWKLAKHSFLELKAEEAKTSFNSLMEKTTNKGVVDCLILMTHLSLLVNLFFNSSFSLLPDLFFYNTFQSSL